MLLYVPKRGNSRETEIYSAGQGKEMKNSDIKTWQDDLSAQQVIWYVEIGGEATGNFYDTREGAELEVEFNKKHYPNDRIRVRGNNLHNLDLSQRRWKL